MIAPEGIAEVRSADRLGTLVHEAATRSGWTLSDGDVVVVAQKIVSKAEGRIARLDAMTPSPLARDLAAATRKDPRLVQLVLDQSDEVLRARAGVMVVAHRRGWVMANAGIDQSNVPDADDDVVLLLPENPDASARALRDELAALTGADVCVVIADSFGRAWRMGVVGVAIGASGFETVECWRGRRDRQGRELAHTEVARADEIAAAAGLLMGQADEGRPLVLMRGLTVRSSETADASDLVRPAAEDMFR